VSASARAPLIMKQPGLPGIAGNQNILSAFLWISTLPGHDFVTIHARLVEKPNLENGVNPVLLIELKSSLMNADRAFCR